MSENLKIDFSNALKVPEKYYQNIRSRLKKWDILIAVKWATIASQKCICFVDEDISNCIVNWSVFRFQTIDWVEPKYIAYYLNTEWAKKQMKFSLVANNAVDYLNKDMIENLDIPLPSLEIQQQIVEKMDSALDGKKNLENKSDEILNSIDDYVLSELWIELTDEKEENNYFIVDIEDIKDWRIDAFYNKPEFKKIEKQFLKSNNVVELKDIIDYVKTWTTPDTKKEPFSNEWIPFLRNTNLQKNEIITDELKYIKNEYKNTITYSEKDDILICIAWTIGVSSVNDFWKIAINQNVSSLKIKQWISPYFISYLLNTAIFSEFFDRVSSVATIKYINNDNLLSIKIPLPSIEIQDKIANEVKSRIEKAKQLKNQATEIYEQAKNEVEKMILE